MNAKDLAVGIGSALYAIVTMTWSAVTRKPK